MRLEEFLQGPLWKALLGEFEPTWIRSQKEIRKWDSSDRQHAFHCGRIEVLDFLYGFDDHLKVVREEWAAIAESIKANDAADEPGNS